VALGAILVSILTLGNVEIFSRRHRFIIDFTNVEALPTKAAVKIAGVEIGKVRKVALVDGRARVTVAIDRSIPIYANALGRVGSTGIIGSKFIELFPGSPDAPELKSGSMIKGENERSLNEMINKLSGLFETDANGNAVDNLKETIANIRNVSRSLNVAMGNHAKEMEEIVMNIRDLTGSLKVFSAHLEEISTHSKEDVKVAIEKFRGVGEKLDAMLAKINRGEGAIGALVNDEKTGKEVKEAVASIKDTANEAKKVLGRFTNINVYWDARYRYDFRDEESKVDVGIKFVPRPGKFYAFGASNIGEPVDDEKHQAYERKNRIDATMGKDYGPFTGYIGAIRSRGGAGLNFRPFFMIPSLDRRFELTTDISDLARDRVVKGNHLDRAVWNAGAHLAVTRWLWLGARAEDLLEHTAFMAYTNVVFRDEDLSYLFGFITLAH
jgi:phospholipid/cholesterol/gamma-HCH transport system substrate-binding protein